MRLRLVLSFALIVLITILSLVLIVRVNTARTVQTFMFRGGMIGVEYLVTELEDYYNRVGSWGGSEELIHGSHSSGMGRFPMGRGQGMGPMMEEILAQRIRLLDADGTVLVDSQDDGPSGRYDVDELDQVIVLQSNGHTVGYLLPETGMKFSPIQEGRLLASLNAAALTAGLIAAGVSLVLAFLLAYSLMRPVRELTRAAVHMADGDLGQRVTLKGKNEIATLGKTFNHMAASLQNAEQRRRALTADIAHELRTPLAVQRAHLEAIQDGIYELAPETLTPILEQNHALTRLVEDLRTLALADSGQLSLEFVKTDFAALVKRIASRFDPQAATQDIKMVLSPMEKPVNLSIDPQRIEQVINNVFSNAIQYTPRGGTVFVGLETTPGQVVLSVQDTGPGIPEESLPFIFERFYKVDSSRTRDDGGTGLGLSIARKIAQTHGGDLSAANHPGGGAVLRLQLPRSENILG